MGRRHISPWLAWVTGLAALAVGSVAVGASADWSATGDAVRAMVDQPAGVAIALGAFAAAFALRAVLWQRVLPDLPFDHALAGIHLSLGANHVLPLRLGEPFRVLSVQRRTRLSLEPLAASTVALRIADIAAIGVLGLAVAPMAFGRLLGGWGAGILVLALAVGAAALWWLASVRRRSLSRVRLPGPAVAAGVVVAWLLEAVLVWHSARWAGLDVGPLEAVGVTTAAVGAQVAAIAPGGFGSYEAASVAAYGALGFDAAAGLTAALVAHGLKTLYALAAGGVALVHPGPGMVGPWRLASPPTTRPAPASGAGPVVLFLPAHDEEATVAQVVARAPSTVCGLPVEVLVVDDGSTDATAARAASAGATVVSHSYNRGLGAAVRTGLAWAVGRDAVAVAFCDADGEYAPEQLADLIGPILDGRADYVVGTRLRGTIEHMRLHRRLGNLVLTHLLAFVARQPITDGQSGYRALSTSAATAAAIVHDFNYAQVLTLDLLAKGFRYGEVPICYRFRTEGRSFVRLIPYLRQVLPAVRRELNDRARGPDRGSDLGAGSDGWASVPDELFRDESVLDDVGAEALPGSPPAGEVEAPVVS